MTYYPGLQQNLPHAFRCANHPDREGVGICVSCRSVVCVECSTKIDRMNYCMRCLRSATAAVETRQENPRADAGLGVPLLIGSFVMAAGVFAVLGFLIAVLRQWAAGGITAG